ncbi:MAG: hypothetical protein ABIT83_20110 [Massilia sp.]
MKLLLVAILISLANGCAGNANAQVPAAMEADDIPSVTIKGNKSAQVWAYRTMETGLDVFEGKRDALAPGSSLRFVVRNDRPGAFPTGAAVKVIGEQTDISIPVAADGGFVMVRSASAHRDKADVALAVGDVVAIGKKPASASNYPLPEVRSPNLPAGAWRLGDLRLQCSIRLAMCEDTLSLLQLAGFKALSLGRDLCGHAIKVNGNITFRTPAPFDSATLIDGERRLLTHVGKQQRVYRAPVHDDSWSNDTLIQFQFSPTPQPQAIDSPRAPAQTTDAI